jgi:dolichyl-phosphate-mannose--protein O-mannosyl transferase
LDTLLITVVVLAALVQYLIRLDKPNGYVFDEVYHAFTAAQLAAGNADAYVWYTQLPSGAPKNAAYEWTHPALSKLFMQVGIHLFGNNPEGWRFFSALFGAAGVGVVFAMGRVMFSRAVGLLGSVLLLLDGLWFVQSRTAMNDVYVTVLLLLAYLAVYGYLRRAASAGRKYVWLCGVALGLAFATKWSAAYSLAILAGLVALRECSLYLTEDRRSRTLPILGALAVLALTALICLSQGLSPTFSAGLGILAVAAVAASVEVVSGFWRREGFRVGPATTWLGAFVLVPAALYLLAYSQFFSMGHTWGQFVELQKQMYYYHSHLKATHLWASSWWTWPLVLKPVWYYVEYRGSTVADVFALANPLVWWAFLPAVGFATYRCFKLGAARHLGPVRRKSSLLFEVSRWISGHDRALGLSLLLIGFLGQWLPWALSPRISFMYHMLPSVPFGCLAIAYALARFQSTRLVAGAYLLVVLAAFVFFYPIYAAVPISPASTNRRYWMDSWDPNRPVAQSRLWRRSDTAPLP